MLQLKKVRMLAEDNITYTGGNKHSYHNSLQLLCFVFVQMIKFVLDFVMPVVFLKCK